MRICGIAIQGSKAHIVVLECTSDAYELCQTIPKVELRDDSSQDDIRSMSETLQAFVRDHRIDAIFVKARNQSGDYAGGAIGFKIEAVVQLLTVPVELIRANAVSAACRNKTLAHIEDVFAYQHDAFKVAYAGLIRKCSR